MFDIKPMSLRRKRSILLLTALFVLISLGITFRQSATSSPLLTPPPGNIPPFPAYCRGDYLGDTSDGDGISRIDAYVCRPDWPETGPEHFYQLQTKLTQPVTITLSYPAQPDLDLDIFLLEQGDPAHCHGADAALSITELPPGAHLVIVDGYEESAGPYSLRIDCSKPPLATPTPTATALPTSTPTPTLPPSPTPIPTATPTQPRLAYYTYLPSLTHRYPPPTPQPTSIVLQQGVDGYAGTMDSFINAWDTSANYAQDERLGLRQSDIMAPTLRFDLGALPENAHVVDAKLSLYVVTQTNANPASVGVYRLNRPWNVTEVNWLQAAESELWAVPGANDILVDREANPRSAVTMNESQVWYTWNVTSLVHEWLSLPETNNGVIFKAIDIPKVYYALASSEYHNTAGRPRLTITYWTPSPPILHAP